MPTFPQLNDPAQAGAPILVNEAFETLAASAVYGKNHTLTSGLTWGYYGGRWAALGIAAGSVTLAASTTNYVVVAVATGAVSVSAATTNWNDAVNYRRAFKIVTGASAVTSFEDHRFAAGGALTATAGSSGGGVSGLEFSASTTTTDADPGTGTLRWNNATQASATQLFIDNADADSTSLATLWASLTSGAFLKIADAANVDLWQLWKVTAAPVSGTGYYKFTVALQAQEGGNIANAAAILLDVDAAGGASGALPIGGTVGQVLAKLSGTDGDAGWTTPSGGGGSGGGGSGGVTQTSFQAALSDETTPLTDSTSVAKLTFRAPYAMTSIVVEAGLTTAQASGATLVTLNVKKNGTTIFSTKPTFDNTEKTTLTAATPAVQTINSWAKDDIIECFVDALTAGSVAAGLKVNFTGNVVGNNVIAGVPTVSLAGDGSTTISTASTSFVDMTGFTTLQIAASVGDILEAEWIGSASNSSSGKYSSIQFIANTAPFGIFARDDNSILNSATSLAFFGRRVVQAGDIVAGMVPIKVQWKTSGGTASVFNTPTISVPLLTVKNYGDGSGIRPSNSTPKAHAFYAYRDASTQLVAAVTFVKVQLNAKGFDTDGCFDATTNCRFTPTKAGYYQINAAVMADGGGVTIGLIYKNGVEFKRRAAAMFGSSAFVEINEVVYFNGTTDYIELWIRTTNAGTVYNGENYTSMSGILVGA